MPEAYLTSTLRPAALFPSTCSSITSFGSTVTTISRCPLIPAVFHVTDVVAVPPAAIEEITCSPITVPLSAKRTTTGPAAAPPAFRTLAVIVTFCPLLGFLGENEMPVDEIVRSGRLG